MCPSKKKTYFGYKVHALVTLEGFITEFIIIPASTDGREEFRELTEHHCHLTLLGDKGYVSETLADEIKEQGICLMALKRSNSKHP